MKNPLKIPASCFKDKSIQSTTGRAYQNVQTERLLWRFVADKNKPKKKTYLEKQTVRLKISGPINKTLLQIKKNGPR